MKKFFIVCEIHSPETIEYVHLQTYSEKTEVSIWYRDVIDVPVDVNSAVDSIVKLCSSFQWEPPHYFDTLKDAKEAVEILKAHDDPSVNQKYKYHIVTCYTVTIPSVVCGIQ